MKNRLYPSLVIALAFTAAACAQDPGIAPPSGQNSGQNGNSGWGGGYGQRGGRGGFGGGGAGMMMGRGIMGTVTAVAADHYTIKTDTGDVYTVHFTADTRIFKRQARTGGSSEGQGGGPGEGGEQPGGGHRGMGAERMDTVRAVDRLLTARRGTATRFVTVDAWTTAATV